ncbi:MAG TPA: hypothetical protein VHW01_15220 [Polyangiaceae bacterium]|nr:hypothetical protein [Polyangiaceae bacterium]
MIKSIGAGSFVLVLSSLPLAGCYFQAGSEPAQPVAAAPVAEAAPQPVAEAEPEYYYGGPHFYPLALGGEWCPIAEPHVHDFPPDHPEWYAYDSGYYYYSGRPGEVYVAGEVPRGARVHVVREGEAHGWRHLPPTAPHAPYAAGGRYPTREEHPAPAHPVAMHGAQNQELASARGPANHETESAHELSHGGAAVANKPEEHGPAAVTASEHGPATGPATEHGPAAGAAPVATPTGTEPRQPREGGAKSGAAAAATSAAPHPAALAHTPAPGKPTTGKPSKGSDKKKGNK